VRFARPWITGTWENAKERGEQSGCFLETSDSERLQQTVWITTTQTRRSNCQCPCINHGPCLVQFKTHSPAPETCYKNDCQHRPAGLEFDRSVLVAIRVPTLWVLATAIRTDGGDPDSVFSCGVCALKHSRRPRDVLGVLCVSAS
jgi:hypothetical protein